MKFFNISKEFIFALIFCTLSIVMASCSLKGEDDFLSSDTSDDLTIDKVFSDSLRTMEHLATPYRNFVGTYYANNLLDGGGLWTWSDMAGDSRNIWSGSSQTAHLYNMDQITSPNNRGMSFHWNNCYNNIAWINIFLANVDQSPLHESTIARIKGEAKFMRAWFYFHLLRLYGGVPITPEVVSITEKIDIKRATFEETSNYIISELDDLISSGVLPDKYSDSDFGRVTSGAVEAVRARVYLFIASPLFNTNSPRFSGPERKYVSFENYDIDRWKKAADAQKKVIDLNRYQLVEDNTTAPGHGFYKMQVERYNNEHILYFLKGRGRKLYEGAMLPYSVGGQVYASPYQELVDAFLTEDGNMIAKSAVTYNFTKDENGAELPVLANNVDVESGYDDSKPYDKRDPRFYYTIIYHGSKWIPRNAGTTKIPFDFCEETAKGESLDQYLRTRYTFRKFCDESATAGQGSNNAVIPFIRYAEILLNYAEALNEFETSSNKSEIDKSMIAIRKRAGIKPGTNGRYGIPESYTQEEMRNIIQNERRIEFALEEGHRYFDLKRWDLLKEAKDNVKHYAAMWSKKATGTPAFYRKFLEVHQFSDKLYFYPIPQTDVDIVNPENLPQNPGW